MTLLTTSRLIIDFVTTEHAEFFFRLMNQPSYIKNIGDRNIKSEDDAIHFIENRILKSYEENGYGYYIIKVKKTSEEIGICGLVNRMEMNFIDIGFALLYEYTKKGYAFEATKALYAYSKNILKIDQIVAISNSDNYKSIALIEKLGMKYVKNIKLPDDSLECKLYSD